MTGQIFSNSSKIMGAIMTRPKLMESRDQYNLVSTDDEDTTVFESPTHTDGDEEDRMSLLDPETSATRHKRKGSTCCVCFGLDCSLFWKAFAIILSLVAIWSAIKLVIWAVSSDQRGLELMPTYSTSLGCLSAPYIYNSSKVLLTAPVGPTKADHAFDIRGSAVGTFVIAQGSPDSQEIKYEMILQTNDPNLFQQVSIHFPDMDKEGNHITGRLLIQTPYIPPSSTACARYDIRMYVPPNLRKLYIASHTPTHILFDHQSRVDLHDLYITLFSMSTNNMILPHKDIHADKMALEVYRGWIVGDASIVNSTSITTQRGDGLANVNVYPKAPLDPTRPDTAHLMTTTGAGRTDIFVVTPKALKRPINSIHLSSRNGDVYLMYRQAGFNGQVKIDARSYAVAGAHSLPKIPETDKGSAGKPGWTHWVENENGGDRIYIKSRGWVGLYF